MRPGIHPAVLAERGLAPSPLTDVGKYAGAARATVRALRENGYAVVEIRDDGVGGADPGLGAGLGGLVAGTVVRAAIPCA